MKAFIENAIVEKYMMGHCHGLAYALAMITDRPVCALFAVKENGVKISDPLHVYVEWDEGKALDVKGVRPIGIMAKDFDFLIRAIGDVKGVVSEELDEPDALFYEMGMNPESVHMAMDDLCNGLWETLNIDGPDPRDVRERVPGFDF